MHLFFSSWAFFLLEKSSSHVTCFCLENKGFFFPAFNLGLTYFPLIASLSNTWLQQQQQEKRSQESLITKPEPLIHSVYYSMINLLESAPEWRRICSSSTWIRTMKRSTLKSKRRRESFLVFPIWAMAARHICVLRDMSNTWLALSFVPLSLSCRIEDGS